MVIPIIGVTTRTAPVPPSLLPSVMVQKSYTDAILNAGGLPVLIPSDIKEAGWQALIERLDGILFTGGGDIAVEYFNGDQHQAVYGIDPARDAIEVGLTRSVVETARPFLGICRGLQVINVALGGTLYTHIHDQHPNALRHDWYPDFPREYLAHPVRVQENSSLAKILGKSTVETNSLHHQGIDTSAPRLTPVAWAPDGIVEAVELTGHRFGLGVQWHPENLQAYPEMRALFLALITAAGQK